MPQTYLYRRPESDCWYFRWTFPKHIRPLVDGRVEVRRSLNTNDKALALRLARRLAVAIDRGTLILMSQDNQGEKKGVSAALILKEFERLVDGTVRWGHLEMDPTQKEAELEMLQRVLGDQGITGSMSRKGDVWDNAAMESFFSSLKQERVSRRRYPMRDEARADLFDHIERFYNPVSYCPTSLCH